MKFNKFADIAKVIFEIAKIAITFVLAFLYLLLSNSLKITICKCIRTKNLSK